MFEYPLEKYRYYVTKNKVIAVSTYAGKTVRGVAKCDPNDHFDIEKGKQLAAARCNQRIAAKRFARATAAANAAQDAIVEATNYADRMAEYKYDAQDALIEADARVNNLLVDM